MPSLPSLPLNDGLRAACALAGPRVRLRPWQDQDLPAFAAMNADPRVMRHFPAPLTATQSLALAQRIQAHFAAHGFGYWVVSWPGRADFLGMVGLAVPTYLAAFTPCVEVAWRLAPAWWGQGLATEAAELALAFGFETLGLTQVVAITVPQNQASRRVMRKLGMQHAEQEDFAHPALPSGHPLSRHVLYRRAR